MPESVDILQKYTDILNSAPSEQCVIREQLLQDDAVDPQELASAANRKTRRVPEIHSWKDRNMALRDFVWVFSPREDEL